MDINEAKKLGLRSSQKQINVLGENFIKIYANNVGIGVSNWDMHLIFGEIVGMDVNNDPIVEQKVKVNMTREFMKALSNLLVANIQEYEATFGELDVVGNLLIADQLTESTKQSPKPARQKKT